MGFLDVEVRWKAASSGRVLVDLDNLIEQVCLGAQIAGGGVLASNDRASLQVGAYRVTRIRGFSSLLHLHGFGSRIRAVSFGSLLADWSACLRLTSQGWLLVTDSLTARRLSEASLIGSETITVS